MKTGSGFNFPNKNAIKKLLISREELINAIKTSDYRFAESELSSFYERLKKANRNEAFEISYDFSSFFLSLSREKPVIFRALETNIVEVQEMLIEKLGKQRTIID